jgi:hypothetical protein
MGNSSHKIFFLTILVLVIFACFELSCNKSINEASNKAHISVTNVVEGGSAVNIYHDGILVTSSPLPFDSTTGISGDPYSPVTAGIRNFKAVTAGANPVSYLDGNVGLSSGVYYSIFLYDTLNLNKAQALILQDNLIPPVDTLAAFRFLNMVPFPDTLNYLLTDSTDTLRLGFLPFIGAEAQPSFLSPFNYQIRAGTYGLGYQIDSVTVGPIDTLTFLGGKLYTIYTRTKNPYNSAAPDTLYTGMVQHN